MCVNDHRVFGLFNHIRMDKQGSGNGLHQEEEIVIIGGGIGGLACALALHRYIAARIHNPQPTITLACWKFLQSLVEFMRKHYRHSNDVADIDSTQMLGV